MVGYNLSYNTKETRDEYRIESKRNWRRRKQKKKNEEINREGVLCRYIWFQHFLLQFQKKKKNYNILTKYFYTKYKNDRNI